jgi:hypothetical protein
MYVCMYNLDFDNMSFDNLVFDKMSCDHLVFDNKSFDHLVFDNKSSDHLVFDNKLFATWFLTICRSTSWFSTSRGSTIALYGTGA